MQRIVILTAAVTWLILSAVPLFAQVIGLGDRMTLKGEIVDVFCYARKGVAEGTGAPHVACAKDCVTKGRALGILTDGDGLFRIAGTFASDNHAKLVPYIGRRVEARGVEVKISNSYAVRSFDIQELTPIKKAS